MGIDNDEEHHKALITRQTKNDKDEDTSKNLYLSTEGLL